MQLADFDYTLPAELIAQTPLADRSASRLLVVGDTQDEHLGFADLLGLLQPGDVLVVNDTRVLKARLQAKKPTGGAAEVLLERVEEECVALCQVRVSKALRPGGLMLLDDSDVSLEMVERAGEFYRLRFSHPVMDVLERFGAMPLPPYIDPEGSGSAAAADLGAGNAPESSPEPHEQRYQTVYAREPGAVAAPTAGLHFTDSLLAAIRNKGIQVVPVTLHVGAGTFQPVRVNNIDEHKMHSERYFITPEARAAIDGCAGRVVAVGTTVIRALESAAASGEDAGDTDIFITPGFRFKAVDALVTNFHLPKSTLLMLIAAFTGHGRMRRAYESAVDQRYRFFSYGDAMFIPTRRDGAEATDV